MKTIFINLFISTFLISSIVGCGGEGKSKNKNGVSSNASSNDKSLLVMKISDPLRDSPGNVEALKNLMGHAADAIEYKHCREGGADLYSDIKTKIVENDEDNDIKTVEIVDKCPSDTAAQCETNGHMEYYYTESARVLDELKGGCAGKWAALKELKDKKAKASVMIKGKTHTFETATNCIKRGNGIQTPTFANDIFEFSVTQYANKDWGFGYSTPKGDGTVTPYETVKDAYQVDFDGKVMKGNVKLKLANTLKQNEPVEVSFEINCL